MNKKKTKKMKKKCQLYMTLTYDANAYISNQNPVHTTGDKQFG